MARPREFDETAVLAAAGAAFRSAGYAATSVSDLTAATGLGKGSLYGAFGDKHGLYLRAFDDYRAGAVATAEDELDGPDDEALARLRAYAVGIARSSTDEGVRRGCMLSSATAELASYDSEVARRAVETFRALVDRIAGTVAGAQRSGDVDPAADPRVLGRTLLAALRGIESLGKAGMTRDELVPVAEAAIAALPAAG